MMKFIFIILSLLISSCIVYADDCTIVCPKESSQVIEGENLINKISGINFASKKLAETLIQKELKDELHSSFDADLDIFSVKKLKNGIFKSLTLKSRKIEYRALYMNNFTAQTICPYNKIIYKKSRLYYPDDLPFKFKSTITNENIQSTINSYEFQKEIERNSVSFNGVKGFELKSPTVKIINDKLYFEIPVKTFFGGFKIKFNTDIAVENNKIILKDIAFNSKSNIMSNSMAGYLINKINPISYEIDSINTKYCKIYLKGIKIQNNKIDVSGIFIINKNYNGDK